MESTSGTGKKWGVPQVKGGSGEYLRYREDVGSAPWEFCRAAYPPGKTVLNTSSFRDITCRIPLQQIILDPICQVNSFF